MRIPFAFNPSLPSGKRLEPSNPRIPQTSWVSDGFGWRFRGTFAFIKVLSGSKTGQGILCRLCQDVRMSGCAWGDGMTMTGLYSLKRPVLQAFEFETPTWMLKKGNKMKTKISNLS